MINISSISSSGGTWERIFHERTQKMEQILNLIASQLSHLRSQLEMGLAVSDLGPLLLSKKGQEALTIQEANMLMTWYTQARRDSTIGFAGAGIVSMLATPRLNFLIRGSLSLGASMVCALWNFGRSLQSSTERFLSLEGSRIQRELTNIMLKKYSHDPWVLRRLPKHFYLEKVYEDSSEDKPKFRWHSRYFYGDPASHSQNASYNEIKTDSSKNDAKKTTVVSEEVYVNTATDASQNPFDFVFGFPGSSENTPPPKTSSTSSRRSSLRERRSRRRHRRRHKEDSDV